jgi:hypothetical protein
VKLASSSPAASDKVQQEQVAPDLDRLDANGNYAPNPANSDKDSLSVGFGFTTVTASF